VRSDRTEVGKRRASKNGGNKLKKITPYSLCTYEVWSNLDYVWIRQEIKKIQKFKKFQKEKKKKKKKKKIQKW